MVKPLPATPAVSCSMSTHRVFPNSPNSRRPDALTAGIVPGAFSCTRTPLCVAPSRKSTNSARRLVGVPSPTNDSEAAAAVTAVVPTRV